ncbi:MAG: GIY-YIG nuclease family protein [Ignavibacteriae bacterium]|nr:GIY-YIG nuclease family protein [Ignavibacteriota bacterium]
MKKKFYYDYIMTNKTNEVLYTGFTSDLPKRVYQHKHKLIKGFTSRYNLTKLVWYEVHEDVQAAIAREKQLKAGSRQKKLDLISAMNPEWRDLSEDLQP